MLLATVGPVLSVPVVLGFALAALAAANYVLTMGLLCFGMFCGCFCVPLKGAADAFIAAVAYAANAISRRHSAVRCFVWMACVVLVSLFSNQLNYWCAADTAGCELQYLRNVGVCHV